MGKLYLAVTPDKYELPMAVCRNAAELGRIFGINYHSVLEALARNDSGKSRGARFIRIEVEEDENG